MKKTILLSTLMLCTIFVSAQDRIHEAGISLESFDHFGLNFKMGNAAALWRFNWMYASNHSDLTEDESQKTTSRSSGVGIGIGREFRKDISESFQFRYGADISLRFNSYKTKYEYLLFDTAEEVKRTRYTAGLGAVLGINYVVNGKLVIGGEIVPGFSYYTGKESSASGNGHTTTKDLSGYDMHFSFSSMLLSIAYRW